MHAMATRPWIPFALASLILGSAAITGLCWDGGNAGPDAGPRTANVRNKRRSKRVRDPVIKDAESPVTAAELRAVEEAVLARGLAPQPPAVEPEADAFEEEVEPEVEDHNETDSNEEYESSAGAADRVSDKPFQGKYWNDAIGVGGGAGGAYGGRFGGKRDVIARGGGGGRGRRHGPQRPAGEFQSILTGLPNEELWVIERPEPGAPDPGNPGDIALEAGAKQGQLIARLGKEAAVRSVPMPLRHTEVQAAVTGWIGTVDVTQQYANPHAEPIEATYVFPLPTNAAVSEFVMQIGDRRIRGLIRDKAEATKVYNAAKRAGFAAALLTQERPNVFIQKVANIAPGQGIDIHIRYFQTLRYVDGWYEWAFPMVVGPRFNPPGSTGGIGAKANGGPSPAQRERVVYLQPDERSGHDIGVTLTLDAGVAIEALESRTHRIRHDFTPGARRTTLTLGRADTLPNKNLVVRWRVAGTRSKTAVFLQPNGAGDGGHFALALYPPAHLADLPRVPMELIFVLDCSGSMAGIPLEKAKAAIDRALTKLRDGDTFQVIRFSNRASQLGAEPLPATADNVERARRYVRDLRGTGGTMMIEGIKAALDFPHDPHRHRVVTFLTDGYIGNEQQILAAVNERLGAARLFSFGVGSAPNRYLLEQMALLGRGAVAWVGMDAATGREAIDAHYRRLARPALHEVGIDWDFWRVSDVYPRRIPDLYVGRPVIVTGRYHGAPGRSLRVTGTANGERVGWVVSAGPDAQRSAAGIDKIWARRKIADLATQALWDGRRRDTLAAAIRTTAMDHSLLSAYTAFVAVDEAGPALTAPARPVEQAVPLPAKMKPGGR